MGLWHARSQATCTSSSATTASARRPAPTQRRTFSGSWFLGSGTGDRPTDLTGLLRGIRLFSELDDAHIATLAAAAQPRDIPAGAWLFRQGDEADYLAVVVNGQLEIVIDTGDDESIARRLGRGAALGELALLTN